MSNAQNAAQKIMASDFDLDNLGSNEVNQITYDCAVRKDLDGNPISGFRLVGKNSDEYVAVNDQIRMDNLKRSAKRSQAIDATTDEGASAVVNVLKRNDRMTAMAVVVGWFGFSKGGVEAPFDRVMLEAMFDKYPTWQNEVLAALEVNANFIKV